MLLFLLLISTAFSFELSEYPEKETPYLNAEVEKLTSVLGSEIAQFVFHADVRTEAGRLNISEESYSRTCLDAYISLKPSPLIHELNGGIMEMVEYMDQLNMTNSFPSNWAVREPGLHSFITNRRAALKRLAANALPETAQFLRNAESHVLDAVFVPRLLRTSEEWKMGVRKIAREYNKLSKESKRDLERTFCARNTFNWINAGSGVDCDPHTLKQDGGKSVKVPFFDRIGLTSAFSKEVELNVEELVKESSYLSTFPVKEIKEKFRVRAAKINVLAQDYVDTCTKSISIMKLSDKERADFGLSTLGAKNEKLVINNTLEMIEINRKTILKYLVPLNRPIFITERLPHLLPETKRAVEAIENEIILGRKLRINRPQLMVQLGERFEDHPDYSELEHFSYRFGLSSGRQFEQVYCLQSTLESILEREVDFAEMHAGM